MQSISIKARFIDLLEIKHPQDYRWSKVYVLCHFILAIPEYEDSLLYGIGFQIAGELEMLRIAICEKIKI